MFSFYETKGTQYKVVFAIKLFYCQERNSLDLKNNLKLIIRCPNLGKTGWRAFHILSFRAPNRVLPQLKLDLNTRSSFCHVLVAH